MKKSRIERPVLNIAFSKCQKTLIVLFRFSRNIFFDLISFLGLWLEQSEEDRNENNESKGLYDFFQRSIIKRSEFIVFFGYDSHVRACLH